MDNLKALGNKVTEFQGFETFDRPKNVNYVEMESDEVTANCPVTGQPDWYRVEIHYSPFEKCIESKTLKLYLQSFRNKGLFCEAFSSQIVDDIFEAIHPKNVAVSVTQKPRGGVAIQSYAKREKEAI